MLLRLWLIGLTTMLLLGPLACHRQDSVSSIPAQRVGEGFPLQVRDSLDRLVTIPKHPERIITLGPALTETLYAIGVGPQLVAVTTMDNYPPECKKLPTIGGFAPETINAESILAMKPDLVLAGGRFQEPIVKTLERLGIVVVVIDPTTLEGVQESLLEVGRLCGKHAEARTLHDAFSQRLEVVGRRGREIADPDRARVLYVLWDDPLMTAGPKTFVGQMIEIAGGKNIFSDARQDYPRISDEVVLGRNPDIVLVPDHGGAGVPERIGKRPGWDRLAAVKNGSFGTVPEDLVNRPGPRLIEGLETIEKIIRKRKS